MKNNKLKIFASSAAALLIAAGISAVPVKAEGYWVDGWWDDAAQVWHEGQWIDDGSQSWNAGAGSYTASVSAGYVPYFSQRNRAWSSVVIGEGGSIGNCGCVPTVMAMITNRYGLGGSPLDMAYLMNAQGHYNSWYGHGADSAAIIDTAYAYGLNAYAVYDAQGIADALASGQVVAACINYGASTHCILLAGVNGDSTTVYDPISGSYRGSISSIVANQSWNPIDWTAGSPFVAVGSY